MSLCTEHPTLILFHATWCGACKNFMPEWNAAAKEIRKLDPEVHVQKIESEKITDAMSKKYKITHYPTVILCQPESSPKRVSARTAKALVDYAKKQSK